jgi:hypothetical protein
VKPRRGPWLSGLILALAVTVWMVGQVMGGMLAMAGDMLSTFPSGPTPSAGPGTSGFASP